MDEYTGDRLPAVAGARHAQQFVEFRIRERDDRTAAVDQGRQRRFASGPEAALPGRSLEVDGHTEDIEPSRYQSLRME